MFAARILLEGEVKTLEKVVKILNMYGPYVDCKTFWDFLYEQGILNGPNLIICGDLARMDPLAQFFLHVFER